MCFRSHDAIELDSCFCPRSSYVVSYRTSISSAKPGVAYCRQSASRGIPFGTREFNTSQTHNVVPAYFSTISYLSRSSRCAMPRELTAWRRYISVSMNLSCVTVVWRRQCTKTYDSYMNRAPHIATASWFQNLVKVNKRPDDQCVFSLNNFLLRSFS